MPPRELSNSAFAIVANGFADGPAQAIRDYLVERDARVVTVFHPLTREQGLRHLVVEYAGSRKVHARSRTIPLRPPLSFAFDPFVPLRVPAVDLWLGFNPLACARGLAARRFRRAGQVVLWSVDFVPDRFGRTPLTWLYDRLDRLCCTRADARVELSAAARDARNRRHGLEPSAVPVHVVPMGAWLERVPTVPDDAFERRRVVFLGHLVPRQGVDLLLEALALLAARDQGVGADVIGTGSEEDALRERARALGLGETVAFHGFVPDHRDVERLLAASSLAVAPYRPSATTFTQHADPGKLKAYVAAGLPVLLTDVPPNASELAAEAGAELVSYDSATLADALASGLASPRRWRERRSAALRYARRFDWPELLGDVLEKLGFRVP
jgi:glycosyltransferase involved in cell wall biosynthesis